MKITNKENRITLYLLIMTGFIALYYIICLFDVHYLQSVLFPDRYDTYADFYNSLTGLGHWGENNWYSEVGTVQYPPVAVAIFRFFRLVLKEDAVEYWGKNLKMIQSSTMLFNFYNMILLGIIAFSISKKLQFGRLNNVLLIITLFFCAPSVFAIERGNIGNLAIALSIFFVCFYDDENKILKELSFMALAVAAAIKLYPAVFGFILLSEKKYRDGIRLAIYGFLWFFIPFIPFGGLKAVYYFLKLVFGYSNSLLQQTGASDLAYNGVLTTNIISNMAMRRDQVALGESYYGNFSLMNISQVIEEIVGINLSDGFNKICLITVILILMVASFVLKEKWKRLLCLGLVITIFSSSSPLYVAVFLLPAFLEFIVYEYNCDEEEQLFGFNFESVMALVFAGFLIPWATKTIPYFDAGIQIRPMYISYLIYYIMIIYMILLITYDLFRSIIKSKIANMIVKYGMLVATAGITISIFVWSL